jgi:predicted Zn finger-like uncharacterized protein
MIEESQMIIQCEKCQTKFRLDDSRVTDKGVKVRCTRCKHVFSVKKEEPEAVLPETAAPVGTQDADYTVASEGWSFPAESLPDHSAGSPDTAAPDLPNEPNGYVPETSPFDTPSLSFDSRDQQEADDRTQFAVPADAVGGEVDFSAFDFGDSVAETPSPSSSLTHPPLSIDDFTDTAIESAPAVAQKPTPPGLDFSDDDMFGAVVQPPPEPSNDAITFDFEGDSFAESMDMVGSDSSGKSGTSFSLDAPGDTPFNLGEIDFGEELTAVAVHQVNPDDLKPSQEILFAPLAEARAKTADEEAARTPREEAAPADQPPLPITSRRKQSPVFGGVIAVVAVLVISILGYVGYSSLSTPKEAASPESGKISVRAVKAEFVENDAVGELLVISGEALNEYQKPRAALQIKVTVFDAAGQSISTKTAYGGNPLTEEQLESMPLDKIEAAMANQFGDSLANMEVPPGKVIPFVVVLANLPKSAKDFSVQSAGSTVATGKQQ